MSSRTFEEPPATPELLEQPEPSKHPTTADAAALLRKRSTSLGIVPRMSPHADCLIPCVRHHMDLRDLKTIARIYVPPLAFTEVTTRSLGKTRNGAGRAERRNRTGGGGGARAIETAVDIGAR